MGHSKSALKFGLYFNYTAIGILCLLAGFVIGFYSMSQELNELREIRAELYPEFMDKSSDFLPDDLEQRDKFVKGDT